MDNISGGMKSLCEDIVTSHEDRKKDINTLKKEAEAIKENARKFVSNCKRLHKEMAEDLRENLLKNREELIRYVSYLRDDFRKKEDEIRSDLAEASKIWNKMNETLKTKKRGEIK
jgi:gas vesicle protein